MKNFNIASTVINDKIRVSTAAIFYESTFFGDYYQVETFIFSGDKTLIETRQIIHGTCHDAESNLIDKAKKIHVYISNNLKNKFK